MKAGNQPIGIFDSGIGGTSVFKEIHRLLPLEKTIYLADSKNAPYGEKPKEEILKFCYKNTDLLLSKGVKIIVVACNTATTNAIKNLRKKYDIPFIGIEPAIKPAALASINKNIGVLATKGTLASDLFEKTSKRFQSVDIIEAEGKGLVKLIESGQLNSPETTLRLKEILKPMLAQKIDYLVLGCTHYPYLIPLLKEILPPSIEILDSGKAVARQTQAILKQLDLLTQKQQPPPVFYTNKEPRILKQFVGDQFIVEYLNF